MPYVLIKDNIMYITKGIKMIYFMTAFFLDLNNANWLWWSGFIGVCIVEHIMYMTRDLK